MSASSSTTYETIPNEYDINAYKSFVNRNNFNEKILISPDRLNNLFYKRETAKDFCIDTLLYLHIFNGIYIEFLKFNKTNSNNVVLWKDLINNLKIQIVNGNAASSTYIVSLNSNTKIITIDLYAFGNRYNNIAGSGYNTTNYSSDNDILKRLPQFGTSFPTDFNALFGSGNSLTPPNVADLYGLSGASNTDVFTKDSQVTANPNTQANIRLHKLQQLMKDLLNTSYTNMLGYVLFYKIYYHVIFFNIQIVEKIRSFYIFNQCLKSSAINQNVDGQSGTTCVDITSSTGVFNSGANANYVITNINAIFDAMRKCLNDLKNNEFYDNQATDYDANKIKYESQIRLLNNINNSLKTNENNLNSALREYNKYIKNFNRIKSYGNYIILFLVAIIVITIIITILGDITHDFKNFYYLIAFFVLAIITYLYYDKFNHIGLYEDFIAISNDNGASRTILNPNYATLPPTNRGNVDTNAAALYNGVLNAMNNYNNALTDIFNELRSGIYMQGNNIFYQDGGNYLYKLYVQKKQQYEANRIRLVNTNNSLEMMKKYVIYLFNIILLMSLLTLILLFGLLLFVNMPFFLYYIIILCVILIIVVMSIFFVAITKPTRMIANKQYWADKNPGSKYMKKLK